MFDLSVASGDPSTSGVVFWTHVAPRAYAAGTRMWLQVAKDNLFSESQLEAELSTHDLPARDYCMSVMIDGQLAAGTRATSIASFMAALSARPAAAARFRQAPRRA